MKEFIEKLIGMLEELYDNYGTSAETYKEALIKYINQLAEEYNNANDSMEIQIAKNYAKWITMCGVNVTEKWETATQQASALNEAYMRGRQDERDRFAEWQDEHNNDFCEWHNGTSSVFPIKTNCGNSIDVNYGYEFCPYCGKKIKVAPYQPKGE